METETKPLKWAPVGRISVEGLNYPTIRKEFDRHFMRLVGAMPPGCSVELFIRSDGFNIPEGSPVK